MVNKLTLSTEVCQQVYVDAEIEFEIVCCTCAHPISSFLSKAHDSLVFVSSCERCKNKIFCKKCCQKLTVYHNDNIGESIVSPCKTCIGDVQEAKDV